MIICDILVTVNILEDMEKIKMIIQYYCKDKWKIIVFLIYKIKVVTQTKLPYWMISFFNFSISIKEEKEYFVYVN